jgi:acetylornithine/succinyldiaminopimelate/putrescine aminotransferase
MDLSGGLRMNPSTDTAAGRPLEQAWTPPVYAQLPIEPVSGEGCFFLTADGRRILDLYGGHAVASLGYGHPRLTAAISDQARRLVFQSNAVPLAIRGEAARALACFAPSGLDRVFLVNSGAEANENALRLALRFTGRPKVVAIEGAFHGRTAAAGAVTWGAAGRWYGFPRTPFDVTFVPRDDVDALAAAVDRDTAAVIAEPVQGVAGAVDLSPRFLTAACELAKAAGALSILDEVQCGMGRAGHAFVASTLDVVPDILTTAKGLGGGFPAGAVITSAELAARLGPGDLGTTFGGGPLACAAIVAVIGAIEDEGLLPRVRQLSDAMRARCLVGPVTAVQGRGFLLGLRCARPAREVRDALLERDILTGTSGDPHVLRLLPPLVLAESHVDQLVDALSEIPA